MIKPDKVENKEFLEKAIDHLGATGFEDIKADIEGYESPKSYVRKGGKRGGATPKSLLISLL